MKQTEGEKELQGQQQVTDKSTEGANQFWDTDTGRNMYCRDAKLKKNPKGIAFAERFAGEKWTGAVGLRQIDIITNAIFSLGIKSTQSLHLSHLHYDVQLSYIEI